MAFARIVGALRRPTRLVVLPYPHAYATYLVHGPILAIQLLLMHAELPPLAKFALFSAASVRLSFALGAALRTAPGLRHIL